VISELHENGSLEISENLDILTGNMVLMLSTVGEFHRNGLVHRDIKLPNFLISNENLAVLSDFDSVIECDSNGSPVDKENYVLFGTPDHLAPELFIRGRTDYNGVDFRLCDVWALGISFCEIICPNGLYEEFARHRLEPENKTEIESDKIAAEHSEERPSEENTGAENIGEGTFYDLEGHITAGGIKYVCAYILGHREEWLEFVGEVLDVARPQLGPLFRSAVMAMLEPERSKALHVDEILEDLKAKSMLEENREEYKQLCEKKNECDIIRQRPEGPDQGNQYGSVSSSPIPPESRAQTSPTALENMLAQLTAANSGTMVNDEKGSAVCQQTKE
jgi:serine/threonine protein kinase